MNVLKNEIYNCPMKNSIIEKFNYTKGSLVNPIPGSKITSYTDSLVFPTMSGIVEKIINQETKSLIIRHNDSIRSVYSNLDTIFVDVNNQVDMCNPLGIAQKEGNRWWIRIAVWNKTVVLNSDNFLECYSKLNE
jgi:hypothetical protein